MFPSRISFDIFGIVARINRTPTKEKEKAFIEILRYCTICHYSNVMASQIICVSIVYLNVCSGADQRHVKAPRHWPLWGEFTGNRWIPLTKASDAENVSIWWRHHAKEDMFRYHDWISLGFNGKIIYTCSVRQFYHALFRFALLMKHSK